MASLVDFNPVPRGALRHNLVGRILQAIFKGQLRAGDRLVVVRLAEQFGVSATPAREALLELTSIGMVDMLPNRGAVVRAFGPAQLAEIYQIRRILEVEAARSACGRIDAALLAELADELQSLSIERPNARWSKKAVAIDCRLHEAIAEHCGNARLAGEIARYGDLVQTVREVIDNHQRAQEAALAEHIEIVTALHSGCSDRAAQAMARHIDSAARFVLAELFPDQASRPR